MVTTVERLFTIADLEAMEPSEGHVELIEGELIEMPPPHGYQPRVVGLLFLSLGRHVEDAQLGFVANEGGFLLPGERDTVVMPDLFFLSNERVPDPWPDGAYLQGAPDLAVEVLSPNDRVVNIERKIRLYLAHGARLVWIINPGEHTVAVWTPGPNVRVLTGDTILDGGEVIPGFEMSLTTLFSSR